MKGTWKRARNRKWMVLFLVAISVAVTAAVAGHGYAYGWYKHHQPSHHYYNPCCYTPPAPPTWCCQPAPQPPCCAPAPGPQDNDIANVTNNVSINQSSWVNTSDWGGWGPYWDGCGTCGTSHPWWGPGSSPDVDVNQLANVSINTNINQ